MKKTIKKFFYSLIILLLMVGTVNISNAAQDTKGNDFWLMFNDNTLGSVTLSLFVTTDDVGVVIDITGPFAPINNVAIPANVVTQITIPIAAMVTTNDVVGAQGIRVTTQNVLHEVTVYGLNRAQFTTDAYLGLPIDILGTSYYPLGFLNNNVLGTLFGIIATQNGTVVTITPSATTMGHVAGVPYNVNMNMGETYQLKNEATPSADLSGTIITSNLPIGVFGGHKCSNVPVVFFCCCDHIIEMMPPTTAWGRNFVTYPLATRLNGDSWRILAKDNGTTVVITGPVPPVVPVLAAGQVFDFILDGAYQINSNNPILVSQYSNSSFYDNVTSDPFEMLIPPHEQFLPEYVVSTPAAGFTTNFLNIVAPTSIVPAGVLVDGLQVAGWTVVGGGFSGTQVPVSLNSHTVVATLPIGVFSYGFADFDSYGYPGGQSLSPVAVVTSLDVTPEFAINPVNTQHCVNGLVLDQFQDPVVGVRVDYLISGANPGAGFAFSDSSGNALFCYVGTNAGCDTIIGSVGNLSDTVIKCWESVSPVELTSFTSLVNGKDVTLNWTTAVEVNNSGFDIERKISSGTDWTKITFVEGNGNTSEQKSYTYVDRNVNVGSYDYRLKQIDFNGNFQYYNLSNEVIVSNPNKFNLSQNYPNPFNPTTKIDFELPNDGNVTLSVYDNGGRLVSTIVNEFKAAGYYTVDFNASNLSSGVYFYKLETNGFSKVMKMSVVK